MTGGLWGCLFSCYQFVSENMNTSGGILIFCQTGTSVFWAKLVIMMYRGQNLRKHSEEGAIAICRRRSVPLSPLKSVLSNSLVSLKYTIYKYLNIEFLGHGIKANVVLMVCNYETSDLNPVSRFAQLCPILSLWDMAKQSKLTASRLHFLQDELFQVFLFFLKLCFSVPL